VTDNKLSGAELKNLVKYNNLATIKFAANNVKDVSELAVLKELTDLRNLDLGGNPVAETEGYREKVLEMFPDLIVLDNYDRDGVEYISEDDEDYGDEDGEDEGDAPEGAEGAEDDLDEEYDDEEGELDYDDEEYGEEGQDDEDEAELGKRKK
jgi:hypothetical protein